jgi:hypothetical protein
MVAQSCVYNAYHKLSSGFVITSRGYSWGNSGWTMLHQHWSRFRCFGTVSILNAANTRSRHIGLHVFCALSNSGVRLCCVISKVTGDMPFTTLHFMYGATEQNFQWREKLRRWVCRSMETPLYLQLLPLPCLRVALSKESEQIAWPFMVRDSKTGYQEEGSMLIWTTLYSRI